MAYFPEYDHSGLCKFLEEKARQGWMYVGDALLGMRFLPIEPRERKFQIVYLPQDELLQVNLERLKDYCAMDGWVFIKENSGRCIFFNDRPDPVSIETDPMVQVTSINKNMEVQMKRYTTLAICNIVLAITRISDILLYGKISSVLLLIGAFMTAAMHGIIVMNYRRWYADAHAAAEKYNAFTSTSRLNPTVYLFYLLLALAILCLAFFLAVLNSQRSSSIEYLAIKT